MKKNKNSQKGFSLIELMMVVVIIGVLAGVGIPQYQKFQMKAKQSEVKSLLSSMYTSQKAFYAEWNQYYGDFNAVGYGLSGAIGYQVGFRGAGAVGPVNHPTGAAGYAGQAPAIRNSSAFCAAGNGGNAAGGECNDLKANVPATSTVGATAANVNNFVFGGMANLDDDGTTDQWTINERKVFVQGSDDITN
jgi:type IV pilus assembly protein PilA